MQHCVATNVIQYTFLFILTQYQVSLRYTIDIPILMLYRHMPPSSLAKAIPQVSLPLPEAGMTQIILLSMFIMCTTGTLFPFYGMQKISLDRASPTGRSPSVD